ncbi:MAG: SIS domain-containing protein [bacterium]|nr:SIS domain-containing protein [bacterium]
MIKEIKEIIKESINLKNNLLDDDELISNILKAVNVIVSSIKLGKKLLIAGNGGSAADSQHIAAELIGRLNIKDRNPIPAIALTTDSSILTAVSNDFGFEFVFEKQLQALANPGDVFLVISTSGNSINLINAVKKSKNLGIISIALLGKDGGILKDLVDIPIIVKHDNTQRIQEAHILIEHIICELVEQRISLIQL